MSDNKTINFIFNFHKPVGQNIAHVDTLTANFDKDMSMQIVNTNPIMGIMEESQSDKLLSCIETIMDEKDERGNYLVNQSSHWIAIFRVIVDKGLGTTNTDYQGFCSMITEMKPQGFRVPLTYDSLKAISKTNFTHPLDKWKYDSMYFKTRKPFDDMMRVATRFKEILEANGL